MVGLSPLTHFWSLVRGQEASAEEAENIIGEGFRVRNLWILRETRGLEADMAKFADQRFQWHPVL